MPIDLVHVVWLCRVPCSQFPVLTFILQVSKVEKFGYGYMATQVASTAAGVVELLNSGRWCRHLERWCLMWLAGACTSHGYLLKDNKYTVVHVEVHVDDIFWRFHVQQVLHDLMRIFCVDFLYQYCFCGATVEAYLQAYLQLMHLDADRVCTCAWSIKEGIATTVKIDYLANTLNYY